MKVTYIHHSSFLIEMERAVLLFDYYKGTVPKIPESKTLYIFASHSHGDHFSEKIFEIGKARPDTLYILSDDIRAERVPQECMEQTHFVKAHQTIKVGECVLETFRSTDEGVAFWITVEERTIYHAGDLNNWYWEGETKEWNRKMMADYRDELLRMKGCHANFAFLVLDSRQEQRFYLGMDDFMKMVDVDYIFPMHFWKDYSVIPNMKALECAKSYKDRIMEIHREGEQWLFD